MVIVFYLVLLIYKDYIKYCIEKVKFIEDNKWSNIFGENMVNRIVIGLLNIFRLGFVV